jgi:hypothetical protein
MTHPECTAVVGGGEPDPNPLFTPPCQCPDCAPTERFEVRGRDRDDGWLRISGDRQRYRVERVTLGDVGTEALG